MHTGAEVKRIGIKDENFVAKQNRGRGFTLIELLVVISIITVLMGILTPALNKARQQSRNILKMKNQREVVSAVTLFTADNCEEYPESVATIGVLGVFWNWQEPMMMTSYRQLSPQRHRSMSAYLSGYIEDASIMFCPNAPRKYKYLQAAWEAGDEWDNPDTPPVQDPVYGTYCFYWNYKGNLGPHRGIFRGPRSAVGHRGDSKLLVSDYFGYDHWRSPDAYGSCERFNGASVTAGTWVSSAYWSSREDSKVPDVKLYGGYTDGHVQSYSSSETVPMKVSITSDGSIPYPDGVGPGVIFLPQDGLH